MLSFEDFLIMTFKRELKREKKGENLIISSAKKIGRPTLVTLPTYYVRFSSYHAQPTYLPKIGRH